jgi:hypothetical protein
LINTQWQIYHAYSGREHSNSTVKKNLYKNERGMPFDYHWKGMNIWDGTGNSKRLHLSNLVKDGINVQ